MKHRPHIRLLPVLLVAALCASPAATGTALAADQGSSAEATTTTTTTTTETNDSSTTSSKPAPSDFESQKLDSKAFSESGSGSDSKGSSSSGKGSIGRFVFGLLVVLAVIYGVHWLLKRWGQSRMQGVAGSSGVIDVVATTQLAQGRALHLVRVGPEMVLVGATDQSITRIGELDANALASASGDLGKGEFQSVLASSMLGAQPGVPNGMTGTGSANQPFIRRFLDNLRLSTAR